jgi:DNA-binding CsgD family transcriptional regulator
LSGHPLSAAVLAPAAGRGTGETIAIIAERRLGVAALTAVLRRDMELQSVAEVRGTAEVHAALNMHRPAVIIEAHESSCSAPGGTSSPQPPPGLPSPFVGEGQDRGFPATTLVTGPNDRPDHFASSVRAAIENTRAATASERVPAPMGSGLSEREREILTRIASGRSTKQVARDCAISPKTVGNHVNNICHKLNLHQRAQLVLFALQQGLTTA